MNRHAQASCPPIAKRRLSVVCKLCGKPMERNKRSKFWHCTNLDLGHRKLVPDCQVPRYREVIGRGRYFRSAKLAKEAGVSRKDLERLQRIEV